VVAGSLRETPQDGLPFTVDQWLCTKSKSHHGWTRM